MTAQQNQNSSSIYPYCLCATVAERALNNLLEAHGHGSYRVSDPWLVGREMLEDARRADQSLPLLLASGTPLAFTHWSHIVSIEVVELHKGAFESACEIDQPQPVNPIFAPIDSLMLKPGDDQLRREMLEGIRKHRQALTAAHLHPYAICETPGFLLELDH
jgi:hypothetical protein